MMKNLSSSDFVDDYFGLIFSDKFSCTFKVQCKMLSNINYVANQTSFRLIFIATCLSSTKTPPLLKTL